MQTITGRVEVPVVVLPLPCGPLQPLAVKRGSVLDDVCQGGEPGVVGLEVLAGGRVDLLGQGIEEGTVALKVTEELLENTPDKHQSGDAQTKVQGYST